jgi:hypothetical protein
MFNAMPEYVSATAMQREAEIRRMELVREAERLTREARPARRGMPRISWGRAWGRPQQAAVAKS